MTRDCPLWWEYAEWDLIASVPILRGLKKNTPKHIVEQFKEDMKASRDAIEKGIIL